jgi:hypothetical protein
LGRGKVAETSSAKRPALGRERRSGSRTKLKGGGGEGAALRHAAHGQDDPAVGEEGGADERVAAEGAESGLDGAVRKRSEGGDEVDEGHPRAAGVGSASAQPK